MVGSAVATMVWSRAASSMPAMRPKNTTWIWRWLRLAPAGVGAAFGDVVMRRLLMRVRRRAGVEDGRLLGRLPQHADDQVLLRPPAAVQGGGRHARGRGHARHGQLVVADVAEEPDHGGPDGVIDRGTARPASRRCCCCH